MTAPATYLDGKVSVFAGDCLDVIKTLADNSIDACVCDPPYHLQSIVKRFAKTGRTDKTRTSSGPHQRTANGFMNKIWDGGDIAFQSSTWEDVLRVLKPGAFLVAFSSTRTYHRMACAAEDAGFIIHPMLAWVFATGFPKAHKVELEGWEGWRYGAQALKPAFEPIFLGQKPFSEATGSANVARWGTGALNIDGCRIGTGESTARASGINQGIYGADDRRGMIRGGDIGRWPANIIHDGSEEVIAAFPDSDGQRAVVGPEHGAKLSVNTFGDYGPRETFEPRNDSGSAARFFASFPQQHEARCCLCRLLCEQISTTRQSCGANNAEPKLSTQSTRSAASVLSGAADSPSRENEDNLSPLNGPALDVGTLSSATPQPKAAIAPANVLPPPLSRIVQNVRSAARLCISCATAIAQGLVASRLGLDPASLQLPDFISERSAQILRRSLALHVEGRESTDIILTTESLKQLFGSVFHAIDSNIASEVLSTSAPTKFGARFRYSSKADEDSRLGSRHPTVKPVDLLCWLARLITPPGGLILDPFAGTGTLGEAAWREGFSAILIEREPEYLVDIARRMSLCASSARERKHESIKARGKTESAGPLFETLA